VAGGQIKFVAKHGGVGGTVILPNQVRHETYLDFLFTHLLIIFNCIREYFVILFHQGKGMKGKKKGEFLF
jgi:hypothetical protein